MNIPYELTYDEYVEFLHAYARTTGDWSRVPTFVGLSGFAVGFALLFLGPRGEGPTIIAPFLLMGISLFMFAYPLHSYYARVRNRWGSEDFRLHYSGVMSVGDSGITWTTAQSRTEWQWAAYRHSFETRRLIVLVRGPGNLVPIPKRALSSPESLRKFRSLLADKIPGPSKGFPVIHRGA